MTRTAKMKPVKAWKRAKPETMWAIVFRDGRIRGMTEPELFKSRSLASCKLTSLHTRPAKRLARVEIREQRRRKL